MREGISRIDHITLHPIPSEGFKTIPPSDGTVSLLEKEDWYS